jgi:hypothetical protein
LLPEIHREQVLQLLFGGIGTVSETSGIPEIRKDSSAPPREGFFEDGFE